MSIRDWFKSIVSKMHTTYQVAVDLAVRGRPADTEWKHLEDAAASTLIATDVITAAAVRRKAAVPDMLSFPEEVTPERIIEVNPWYENHAKIVTPFVQERVTWMREVEQTYYQENGKRLRSSGEITPTSTHRLRMMNRNASGVVANISEQVELADPRIGALFPFSFYSARHDGRTRPTHAMMDGFVAVRDWDGWKIIRPKNGFNCRCVLIHRTRAEAKAYGWLNRIGEPAFTVQWPNTAARKNFEAGGFPDPGWQGPKFVSG